MKTTPPLHATGVSREGQIGKAAEHVACADLLLQGFNAFLSDAGQPYDIIVDTGETLLKVQVKGTLAQYKRKHRDQKEPAYRFGLRRGRHYQRIDPNQVDVCAFVALDTRRVAYLRIEELTTPAGVVAGLAQFADETLERRWGMRTFQKCARFPAAPPDQTVKVCFHCGETRPATSEHFNLNKKCAGGITGICRVCYRREDAARKRAKREARCAS